MAELIKSIFFDLIRDMWNGIMNLSYWVVCLSSIVSVSLYAVSRNKKYMQYVGIAFTIWIFMKGFDSLI